MKISIITVCYNSEKTIKNTLDSVLSQTYKNYEYIIIDGKSTDNTIKLIKKYEKKFQNKLKYISEKDNGIYDAMNKGIKLSTGDIIGIINSDDILAHENVFLNVITNIKNYDGVYSNLLMLDNNLLKPYRLFKSKKTTKKLGWHPPHPTLYLKKDIYTKYNYFNTNYKIAADLDFMLKIINDNINLKYVDDYFVYMRAGGISTNGLKSYKKSFKESYIILKNNKYKFAFFTNLLRTTKVLFQKINIYNKKEIWRATHLSNKPKLIQINTVCNTATGKIMKDIQIEASNLGYQTLSIYGRRKGYKDLNCIKIGNNISFLIHIAITTLFDKHGYGSYFKTKKIIKILKKEKPDIIHLHNIHGYYLNFPTLFKYLKKEYNGKIFWTLHDCWTFTGHCAYFTRINCKKWKKGCYKCNNKTRYPISLLLDSSKSNYLAKKEYFTNIKNLTIITPSNWLKKLVEKSFLQEYPIITINNGIDTKIFKYTPNNTIKTKYKIPNDKKIILGVANVWEDRKGLKDFIELSKIIDNNYIIILVGINKKQKKELPNNIIGIHRTNNQNELANLYSIASAFVNPTYEDNYPTVNIEALACKTPVITYNTGGCLEQINKTNGIIIKKEENPKENAKKIKIAIEKINKKEFEFNNKIYNKKEMVNKILKLYNSKKMVN